MPLTDELIKSNGATNNNVNHPRHYNGNCSLECIDAMEIAFGREAVMSFCKGNAFKYLWRHSNKGKQEDLDKALWYCGRVNSMLYEGEVDIQLNTLVTKINEHIMQGLKTGKE